MKIKQLREQRNALAKEVRNVLDQNRGASWNDEHQKAYDGKMAEIERLDKEIDREQRQLDLEADTSFRNLPSKDRERRDQDKDPLNEHTMLDSYLRTGQLNAEQWQHIRNTMSTTTPSEGGYTVQTEVAKQIADALKGFRGVRAVADVMQTAQGNPMNWPNSDGTSETGEQIAENTTATAADPVFGTQPINCYKFSSKIIAVPFELLQDSVIDMEAFLRGRLETRLGRITNTKFTTGTGSSEPRGVSVAAGAGKVGTTGQTLTVIYDDLVDLADSVDYSYQELGNCRFMLNQSSRKVVRKIKDTAGRPIWTPSYDAGITQKFSDQLLGYPVSLNNDIANMAANAKSILFGDFTFYKIRDALNILLFRFTDSAYAKLGQVGFLAWMRSGGNYVDVGGGLKYYQNSAT